MSTTTPNSLSGTGPLPQVPPRAALDPAQVAEAHRFVLEWTRHVFGCAATIEEQNDPESGTLYFVVNVVAAGTEDELVAKWHEWHSKAMPALTPCGPDYCLWLMSVDECSP